MKMYPCHRCLTHSEKSACTLLLYFYFLADRFVCLSSVACVLRLNSTSYGVGEGTVGYGDDDFIALNSDYISLCSGLAAILTEKFLPAAVTHMPRIAVSYLSVNCSVRYSSGTLACIELCSRCGKWLYLRDRKLDIGATIG